METPKPPVSTRPQTTIIGKSQRVTRFAKSVFVLMRLFLFSVVMRFHEPHLRPLRKQCLHRRSQTLSRINSARSLSLHLPALSR